MKYLVVALALSFFSQSAFSKPVSDRNIRGLIQKIETKLGKRKLTASTKLVNFWISPAQPKAGENVTIFAQNETGFSDSDILMDGRFDGQDGALLEHPAKELWIYEAGSFTEQRDYTFTAKLFLQDKNEAKQIKEAIASLETEIASLNEQIGNATDPQLIADLTALRDEKVSLKNELVAALANLKTAIGEESFTFSVGESTDPSFPKITSVDPDVGPLAGGNLITINGQNFGSNPVVKIGGLSANLVNATSSDLGVEAPSFSVAGAKDIEIRFTEGGKVKNAIRKNGYYATSGTIGTPRPDSPPVAVAGPSQTIQLGASATFSGSDSYDPNPGKSFTYRWEVISKPLGSNIQIPTNPPGTDVNFSLTPDVPGAYVISLQVFENGSSLVSSPSLTILTATAPNNRAPSASASDITVALNASATRQISVSDADSWQTHSYFIVKQPSIGSASVSTSGLVTYQAGANEGQDSIGILVADSGSPALSSTVTININQIANLPPVIDDLDQGILSRGVPYSVALFSNSAITDPDGQITSLRWNFGDGTSERTTDPTAFIQHNYNQVGDYTATLTATDNLGGVTTRSFTVSVVDTDIPTAKFKASAFGGSAPVSITFDASDSSDSDGPLAYFWSWGAGQPFEATSSPTISHTFTESGVYQVSLATVDQHKALGSSSVYIFVDVTPPLSVYPAVPDFQVSPARRQFVNDVFSFDGSRSFNPNIGSGVEGYIWKYDDYQACQDGCVEQGNFSTRTHSYAQTGTYYPSLQVVGPDGVPAFMTGQEIYVVNAGFAPRAVAVTDVSSGVAPLTVHFASESYDSDGTIAQTVWGYSDPNCTENCNSEGTTATYTYTQPGVYFPFLGVYDNDNNFHGTNSMIEVLSAAEKKEKNKKPKRIAAGKPDPYRENNRRVLTNLCGSGKADSCYFLAKMYEEDGSDSLAQKLKAKACSLGYQAACEVVRSLGKR